MYYSVVEYQKRGLAYYYILIILSQDNKIRTSNNFNNIIYAEIPNPKDDPELYSVITTYILHSKCRKAHPKATYI